ncbi:MAG: DUF3039 domain-containing protein [Sporichthyaceae bacterium]
MHSRRARPTLRCLAEDLADGWDSPRPLRLIAARAFDDLHPLGELPHPIVAKAAESFAHDAELDNFVGLVQSCTAFPLMEIKLGQWRGGVWKDPETGVHWLVVAGLAKGGHQDHDDFYVRVKRENDAGESNRWLPTTEDIRLLRRETASRLMTEWELTVQRQIHSALEDVHAGGSVGFGIAHPLQSEGDIAALTINVTAVRDVDYDADEIELEIRPVARWAGSDLLWQLILRALISLSPPEQGWDRYRDTFSTIAEPGGLTHRLTELGALVFAHELAQSEPGTHSHYAHRRGLAGSTIQGDGIRAICGVFFVPTRDHETLPRCPVCAQRFAELPK